MPSEKSYSLSCEMIQALQVSCQNLSVVTRGSRSIPNRRAEHPDRADGAFRHIGIHFDTFVVKEARKAFTARRCVADRLGELCLLTDQRGLGPRHGSRTWRTGQLSINSFFDEYIQSLVEHGQSKHLCSATSALGLPKNAQPMGVKITNPAANASPRIRLANSAGCHSRSSLQASQPVYSLRLRLLQPRSSPLCDCRSSERKPPCQGALDIAHCGASKCGLRASLPNFPAPEPDDGVFQLSSRGYCESGWGTIIRPG